MKKVFTLVLILFSVFITVAQDQTNNDLSFVNPDIKIDDRVVVTQEIKEYNKWSVNASIGYNFTNGPFSPGHSARKDNYFRNPNFNRLDVNVRNMFNNNYGLMMGVSYDKFSSAANRNSIPFDNDMFGTNLQVVINAHRVLNWESFTSTFGLQIHVGPGLTFIEAYKKRLLLTDNKDNLKGWDRAYSVISGATVLIKVSDRVALNVDYSLMKNFLQNQNFDGYRFTDASVSKNATVHAVTAGIILYLGKKQDHVDWYLRK